MPDNAAGSAAVQRMVDRRSTLSYEEFVEEYARPGKPVILTAEMDEWKARTLWTLDYLKSCYGSMTVMVRHSKHRGDYYEVALGDYIEYLMDPDKEEDPLYLADWDFSADLPELLAHYQVPKVFKNWLRFVPRAVLPPLRWFYIGPATSGTGLHVDIAMTSAWNAVFSGRKRWVFFAPEQAPCLYEGKVNAFAPDLEQYPLFAKAEPLYAVQNPGDIMYTPNGWWHQLINEEDCVSITENFINEVNCKQALVPYAGAVWQYQKQKLKALFRK